MSKPLIQCLTNRVTAYAVAEVINIAGARPIMSEAAEELAEIIPDCQGVLLNMGTPTKERFLLAHKCCELANRKGIPILLDPVGCGQTRFRLENNLELLKRYKIQILKVNLGEAMSLLEEKTSERGIGVDGNGRLLGKNENESLEIGKALHEKIGNSNSDFILVITGKKDIIISNDEISIIKSRSNYLSEMVGTGCMLGGLILSEVARMNQMETYVPQEEKETICQVRYALKKDIRKCLFRGSKRGAYRMKKAGEEVTLKMKGDYKTGSFLTSLLDTLSQQRPKLYLITDEKLDFHKELLPRTKWALEVGIDYLQYRVKEKNRVVMKSEILELQRLCHEYDTPLIINDYLDLAKELKADGVHLGNQDKGIKEAIQQLGESTIIGATAKTIEQAKQAYKQGASYLGVGALFPSITKRNAIAIEHKLLQKMSEVMPLPMFGIGGITQEKITGKIMRPLDGLAMINAIYQLTTKEEIMWEINMIKEKMLLKYEVESEDKI